MNRTSSWIASPSVDGSRHRPGSDGDRTLGRALGIRHRLSCAVALALAVATAACSGRETAAASTTSLSSSSPTSSRSRARRAANDPCSLLETGEVEAVVGKLAGPPYRSREGLDKVEPVIDGDTCVYETADFRTVLVTVTWKDGAMALKAMTLAGRVLASGPSKPQAQDRRLEDAPPQQEVAKTLLPGAVQIDGEWDEASSFGCCTIYALRGDRMITFDYRGWRADTARAVSILNKALVRLDKPLEIEGNAGNEAARKRAELRPKPRAVCGLLARADVESVVGPLVEDPMPSAPDDTKSCRYRFTQAEAKNSPFAEAPAGFKSFVGALTGGRTGLVKGAVDVEILVLWRGGFRQLADSALVAGAVGANFAGLPGMPPRSNAPAEGSWDEAAQNSIGFTAVKKDVSFTINTEPMLTQEQIDLRRRLVSKVVEKL